MRKLLSHAIKFFVKTVSFLKKPKISDISTKEFLTEEEFALYLNRSSGWVYDRLRKQGVFMENRHIYDFYGVILYDIKQIVSDIKSDSIN